MGKISVLIRLLRVHQYLKNGFVFLPLFFSRELLIGQNLMHVFAAAISFCFVASFVYIFNDIVDVESDRLHPKKCLRPIAANEVSFKLAIAISILLLIIASGIALWLKPMIFWILCVYVILNISYTIKLKHISILDISIVALGFVLRLFTGGIAGGVVLSKWIVLVTFVLSLFLALAKRRDDVLIYYKTGHKARKSIDGYNLDFLNAAMSIMAAITLMSYILYTVSPEVIQRVGNDHVYLTVFFVLIGVMRYLQITLVGQKCGSPTEVLLKDRMMQLSIVGWIGAFVILLYNR